MGFFKTFLSLFQRAPREGIYSAICQMAHDSGARYALESNGVVQITRGDGAKLLVTPLPQGVFHVCDRRVDGHSVEVDLREEWLLFSHISNFLNPSTQKGAAP